MQGINELENLDSGEMLTAKQLLEITSTVEELFEQKREDIKANFMTTMVKLAREQGRKMYAATFQLEEDTSLLDTIIADFQALGYKTLTEDGVQKVGEKEVQVRTLGISWAPDTGEQNVSEKAE